MAATKTHRLLLPDMDSDGSYYSGEEHKYFQAYCGRIVPNVRRADVTYTCKECQR